MSALIRATWRDAPGGARPVRVWARRRRPAPGQTDVLIAWRDQDGAEVARWVPVGETQLNGRLRDVPRYRPGTSAS